MTGASWFCTAAITRQRLHCPRFWMRSSRLAGRSSLSKFAKTPVCLLDLFAGSTYTWRMVHSDKIRENALQMIGNTPIVRLNRVVQGVPGNFFAKVEFMNPGGSIKDRIGWAMIEDAEKKGLIKPGGTVVEGTSGNTGVGLAIAAAIKGYKCIFVLPDKMSEEKIRNLRSFGAKVVVTPTAVEPDDPRSYYQVSRRIAAE